MYCIPALSALFRAPSFEGARRKIVLWVCNDILNHTSLYQYHQGKLLIHLTVPFEQKPKNSLPGDNLRYYRLRKSLTTRQLAETIGVVPATIIQYENNLHPIPYDAAVGLANALEIDQSLLFDDFAVFLAKPYTKELCRIRMSQKLSQREFAELIGIAPSYYYKIEEGVRRPSRKVFQQIMQSLQSNN